MRPTVCIPASDRGCWNRSTKWSWHTNWRSGVCTRCGSQRSRLSYQEIRIEMGFRADLIIEDQVIVEIKSVDAVAPVHKKQLLTHLRLADKRLGLLINFNVALIKDGITRVVNGLPD